MTTEPAIEQPPAQPGPAEGPQLELSAEYLAEFQARVDQLVTEDDTPVDTIFSEKQMRLLTEPLYSSWQGPGAQRSFVVLANVGVFPSINEPPVVPDVLLSLDVRLRAAHRKAQLHLHAVGNRQGTRCRDRNRVQPRGR